MSSMVPSKVFLTRGKGQHREKLVSFEQALRDAGIAPFNLVKVSSIFPPQCRLVPREKGLRLLRPGQIVFLVMSENSTDEPFRLISASIGMAVPNDRSLYGYLAEHEGFGQTEKEAGRYTEDLAAEMLATKLGRGFDVSEIWSQDKKTYRISAGLLVKARSITQTAEGAKGLWTTSLAAAVFIP